MTDTAGIPGDRICSFIERIEHIDDEIKALNEGKKEVFAEAKGDGVGWHLNGVFFTSRACGRATALGKPIDKARESGDFARAVCAYRPSDRQYGDFP